MTNNNILPTAPLVQVELEGEPSTDKAFEHDGVTYRVRLIKVNQASLAILTSKAAVAPFVEAFDVTVTRLGADGAPVKLNDGRVVIVAQTRLTFDADSAKGGLNPKDQLDMIIGNLIHQASQVGIAQLEIEELSQDWGGAVSSPSAEALPYAPPSLPDPVAPYLPPPTPEITQDEKANGDD